MLPLLETIRLRFDVDLYEPAYMRRIYTNREAIEKWIALGCKVFAHCKSPNSLEKRVFVTYPDGTTSRLALQPDGNWGASSN